jgi:hypothetical protein
MSAMDRVDHAAIAAAELEKIAGVSVPTDVSLAASTFALANATLALVEQQRVANLIAVQHIEFLAGNSHFEANLWNEHIGPALGFLPRGAR